MPLVAHHCAQSLGLELSSIQNGNHEQRSHNKQNGIHKPCEYRQAEVVEAKKLIDESGLEVHSAIALQEAADLVQELV